MEAQSQDPIEYYEIQEIEEIPRRMEPSITENPSKDIVQSATYLARRDLPSNSTSTGRVQEETLDDGTEVILLLQEKEPARRHQRETTTDRRVFELSDKDCKLALRRQLEMTNVVFDRREDATSSRIDENAEMLRKLPPDTIVTRQEEARSSKAENKSDYKELTETNSSSSGSGGSSSTSDFCATAKVKRIPRAVRNKTRETVEVRRNPMRMSKKDLDKDFARPRQRLLANRREVYANYEVGKRTRSSATPYMNTRSVTRKMYTVGATYQAPTKRDETEWKEWPVHGMHERPVYHPQAGLAVEYLGRYFVSLDGLSYCEIVDESEVEVVAVDPRYDRRPSSAEKKPTEKAKAKSKRSSNLEDILKAPLWTKVKSKHSSNLDILNAPLWTKASRSFETCMHGSLHCVLGYCSQVMTPSYRQVTEEKSAVKPIIPAAKTSTSESTKEILTNFKGNTVEDSDKFVDGAKLLEGYAFYGAMTQSIQSKSTATGRDRAGTATVASSSTTYAQSDAQRSIREIDGSKVTSLNNRTNLSTLQDFSNASLVLLRNSGVKSSGEVRKAKNTKDTFDPVKEDAPVSEEPLSIYKKLKSADEATANREVSPARDNIYTLKRHSTSSTHEYNPKKRVLNAQLEYMRDLRVAKETDGSGNADNAVLKQPSTGPSVKNRSWCTSETSEIARILSEYNRGATRKPAMQIYGGESKGAKTNLATSSAKHPTKASCFWQRDPTEENRDVAGSHRDVGLDLSQGTWKKLLMPKNTSDQIDRSVSTSRPGRLPASSGSNQGASLRDLLASPIFSSYSTEKPAKKLLAPKNTGDQVDRSVSTNRPGGSPASSGSCQSSSLRDLLVSPIISNYSREKPAVARKDLGKQQPRDTLVNNAKQAVSGCSKNEEETLKTENCLQELLENTAVLYCAANGVHQDDLSSYIDTLDSKQSIQWLETWKNSIV